jgi:seryl-tRNA synthetase
MIDIKDLIKRPDFYKIASKNKGLYLDKEIDSLIFKKQELNNLITERDKLRAEINKLSKNKPDEKIIAYLKQLKSQLKNLILKINQLEIDVETLLKKIPNPPLENVPIGKSDKDNVVIKYVGEISKKNVDYLKIANKLDLIDIQRASKISGTRFAFLKKDLVLLELAIISFVIDKLTDISFIKYIKDKYHLNIKENIFTPILPPVLIKKKIMEKLGYLDSGEIDFFETKDDKFYLIGTAEHSLVPYFQDEILKKDDLPIRFLGFSVCFRKEAGSYGKDTRGIFRVHQFDKLEMVSFVDPHQSEQELFLLLAIEEELMQFLKIPYRVIERCSADLGQPTAKGFDIEAWFPSENNYRETHSCSTTTDYQARRLNIKFREKSQLQFVHILNATAFALGRIIIAILENHYEESQNKINIPECLTPYTKIKEIRI